VQGTLLVAVEDSAGGRSQGPGISVIWHKAPFSRRRTRMSGESAIPSRFATRYVHDGGCMLAYFGDKTAGREVGVSLVNGFSKQPGDVRVVIPGSGGLEETIQVARTGPSLATTGGWTTSARIRTYHVAEYNGLDSSVGTKLWQTLLCCAISRRRCSHPKTKKKTKKKSDPRRDHFTGGGPSAALRIERGTVRRRRDNNNDYIGRISGQNYSPRGYAVSVRMRTSQFCSETPPQWRSVVISSTRTRSDEWHGSGAYYYRGNA